MRLNQLSQGKVDRARRYQVHGNQHHHRKGRNHPRNSRSAYFKRIQRLPLVAWGGLLLLVSLCTTLPLMQRANRSLHIISNPSQLSHQERWAFLRNIPAATGPMLQQLRHSIVQPLINSNGRRESKYDDDTIPIGTLSNEPRSYFRTIQHSIDTANLTDRCERYGFGMTPGPNASDSASLPPRRIFYGSLIAEEPWELLEIVAAETYGIFEAMIFVEGNRTQTATPKPFKRTEKHIAKFRQLFGVDKVQIRRYVNEDILLDKMAREHRQRQEILKGWKEMGMTANDVGYIADADETFTRDFLRAIQSCPYVEALDYETHHCFNPRVKIAGFTRMFESSPECIAKRTWYHPDMILGACIELIGNETLNPPAPRVKDYLRAKGYAHNCETRNAKAFQNSFGNIQGNHYPLWSAADFRRQCGGRQYKLNATNHTIYTAYHFHNFFADFKAARRKYKTYGHAVLGADKKRLEHIGDDLKMMVRCVRNLTDAPTTKGKNKQITETQQWQREVGGLEATLPPWPIYFMDADYRQRKHHSIAEAVKWDERRRQASLRMTNKEKAIERVMEEAQEMKRRAWAKEAQMNELREELAAMNTTKTATTNQTDELEEVVQ